MHTLHKEAGAESGGKKPVKNLVQLGTGGIDLLRELRIPKLPQKHVTRMELSIGSSDRSRRADQFSPNERSVGEI